MFCGDEKEELEDSGLGGLMSGSIVAVIKLTNF